MTRFAKNRRVFFVEEPELRAEITPHLKIEESGAVTVVVPQLPPNLTAQESAAAQRRLLDGLLKSQNIENFVAWYYTPMALAFTDHWSPRAIVYDCMDQLSAFKGAPPGLTQAETRLLQRASLVLTGGHSLFKAKRHLHDNVHPFPSSVDVAHFAQARKTTTDPDDQAAIPHPRLGFIGVIDERMDLELVDGLAAARPDWHIVMVGPVVKIDPDSLPRRENLHFLGGKTYDELPRYLAGWDVALMPFARNESTKYISPTKTPEYLAGGRPVVSTSITDVVEPYGKLGLVRIADTVPAFVAACEEALAEDRAEPQRRADAFLRKTSWDDTFARMDRLIEQVVENDEQAEVPGIACSTISS
jgi:UDP-galactopyranose mutase